MNNENFEYVGFWLRVGAAIIDGIIIAAITFPVLIYIYGSGYLTDPNAPLIRGPADFLISWVLPATAVIILWLKIQATPGKMVIRARVVDARTGQSISGRQAILRYLAYFIAMLPLLLGIIWVGFDPRKQGWHDKLAGTVVIRPKYRGPEPVRFDS